jgi:hypothetical protein
MPACRQNIALAISKEQLCCCLLSLSKIHIKSLLSCADESSTAAAILAHYLIQYCLQYRRLTQLFAAI